ncbi:MAG TPA: nucleotide exchange factor GrpE [Bryobacteraceae bacterium]|nr:nucleotide exchange factor GrpE [Bryobacteraceae bacterium]
MADDNPEQNVSSVEDSLPVVTPEAQIAALTAERDQLAAEKADLKDRLLRALADFDNFRRRAERDRSDYVQFAAMEILRGLIPILDDFRRALKVETADKEYAKGIELIAQRLFETLKKAGLEPIEAAGKPFDPNLHQAVDRVQSEELPDQTVLEEYQSGYNFKGKLLRPAMVKVAVKP